MRHLVALLVLCATFHAGAADRAGTCGQALLAEVPLAITPAGEVLLPASLGQHEVYFALRMGSGLPLMIESSLQPLGLTPSVMNGTGRFRSGAQQVDRYVKLQDLRVDGFRLMERSAPVMPGNGEGDAWVFDGRIVAGILGSDMFRNVDAELQLATRTLRLYRAEKCTRGALVDWQDEAEVIPMWFDEAGTLTFNLEVNDRRVEATLLSGDPHSRVDGAVATRFLGLKQEDETQEPTILRARFTAKQLGLSDVPLRVSPALDCKLVSSRPVHGGIGYACLNVVPLQLGTELLQRLRVYISAGRQQVLIARLVE